MLGWITQHIVRRGFTKRKSLSVVRVISAFKVVIRAIKRRYARVFSTPRIVRRIMKPQAHGPPK